MAKLVAALCPKCGANVTIDPSRDVAFCTYCGTSSFVQTDRRPATQQIAQGYPVIHVPAATTNKRGILIAALVAVGFVVTLGSALVVYLVTSSARPATMRSAQSTPTQSPFSNPLSNPPAPSEELFKDATLIPKRLSAAIGTPLKGIEMEIYPDRVSLKAQDPKNPTHMDEYTYRDGEVSAPTPISMTGGELRELPSKLFDVNAIDYSKVPFMVQDTLNVVSVEDGKVIYLFIEMGAKEPFIRVYVTGPRVSAAYAEYSFKGERRMFSK